MRCMQQGTSHTLLFVVVRVVDAGLQWSHCTAGAASQGAMLSCSPWQARVARDTWHGRHNSPLCMRGTWLRFTGITGASMPVCAFL